jgi:ADP-ribose pyrophosphatase YjhB (NUDIX family)
MERQSRCLGLHGPLLKRKKRRILMVDCVHTVNLDGRNVTLTWVGLTNIVPARVYAIAFVSASGMLLVSGGPHDPHRWLPGGGVEPGETPERAIHRELIEEADATIMAFEELGSQRLDDAQGVSEYHRFYWCRVILTHQEYPRAESTLRHIVSPANFLDTLQWGRSDPKAPLLLDLALEADARYTD